MRTGFVWVFAGLLLLAWELVHAAPPQTVYRCGPDGRIYSQTPCADGKALSTDDPRSASQQKAARDVAERDSEQAKKLAEELRQREAASTPSRKPKAASAAADSAMSPAMRVPAQSTASK